jgi:4-alpha-glucanotransferase
MHPTSLPSPYGIGDFGETAFEFAGQLAAAGVSIWQVLPLGPTGYGNSPYQAFSAFAGEPLLIALDRLVHEGLLSKNDLKSAPRLPAAKVDYDRVRDWKLPLLTRAYQAFRERRTAKQQHLFTQFCADHAAWLDDYALFNALRHDFGPDEDWTQWDKALVKRVPGALAKAREKLAEQIACEQFLQWVFYSQWAELRAHCSSLGVKILGDIPIYVSANGADVWAHPKYFLLDDDGRPSAVAGVPPDYFSATGQRWGNPIYNWKELEQGGFEWWIDRFRGNFHLYDALRVDHFRGFQAYWEVPASEKTAMNGKWKTAPGEKLFHAVASALGQLEIVAENLGIITPEVEKLRRKFGFPGMAILQFAFSIDGSGASYRPHNLEREVVGYTGTHDNDTVVGWWNSGKGDSTRKDEDIRKEKEFTLKYLGGGDEPIEWKMMRALFSSVAQVAIVPMQDVLGLGSDSRMNRPGVGAGNWAWRMLPEAFSEERIARLRDVLELYDRIPKVATAK